MASSLKQTIAFVILICTGYAVQAEQRGVYRESKGQLVKVPVKQTDERLCYIPFVKFKDGSSVIPRRFFGQKHFSSIGVVTVEKNSPMMSFIVPNRQDRREMWLPKGDDIAAYQFLVCRPVKTTVFDAEYGRDRKVEKWTDCTLFEVSAADLLTNKELQVPPFAELEKEREARKQVFDALQKIYAEELARSKAAGSKPVTADTKLDWWQR